eukprot:scaffold23697_cov59-Phaeocystis_antarctica.AAC.1
MLTVRRVPTDRFADGVPGAGREPSVSLMTNMRASGRRPKAGARGAPDSRLAHNHISLEGPAPRPPALGLRPEALTSRAALAF